MPPKRIRVTKSQIKVLVDEMENNAKLNSGALNSNYSLAQRQKDWFALGRKLNADVFGAEKSVEKWQKCWCDYKMEVKRKYRDYQDKIIRRPVALRELTSLDRRILKLMGIEVPEGFEPKVELEDAASDQLTWEISQISSFCQEPETDTTQATAPSRPLILTPATSSHFQEEKDGSFPVRSKQDKETNESFPGRSKQDEKTNESFPGRSKQDEETNGSFPGRSQQDEETNGSFPGRSQQDEETNGSSPGKNKQDKEMNDNSTQQLEAQSTTTSAIMEVAKALRTLADIQSKFLEIEDRKASAFEKIAEHFCK